MSWPGSDVVDLSDDSVRRSDARVAGADESVSHVIRRTKRRSESFTKGIPRRPTAKSLET